MAGYWRRFYGVIEKSLKGSEADFRMTPQDRSLPVSDEAGHLLTDGLLLSKYALDQAAGEDLHHVFCGTHCHWLRVKVKPALLESVVWVCPIDRKQRTANRTDEFVTAGLTGWGEVVEAPIGLSCEEAHTRILIC